MHLEFFDGFLFFFLLIWCVYMIKAVGIKQKTVLFPMAIYHFGVAQVNESRASWQPFLILKSKSTFYEPHLIAGYSCVLTACRTGVTLKTVCVCCGAPFSVCLSLHMGKGIDHRWHIERRMLQHTYYSDSELSFFKRPARPINHQVSAAQRFML